MTFSPDIMARLDALEDWIDLYNKEGKTFRQFWDEYNQVDPELQAHMRSDASTAEEWTRYNFVGAALDHRGFLYGGSNLDRPITDGYLEEDVYGDIDVDGDDSTARSLPDPDQLELIPMAMKQTREQLDARMDALALSMPKMLADTSECCQMDAFAAEADEIREDAGGEDQAHVWARLQCILRDAGLIPGDDEPCGEG